MMAVSRLCTVVLCLVACGLGLAACTDRQETATFLEAREKICTGDYGGGATAMEAYVTAYPDGAYTSRAGLFLGKAALAGGDFAKAAEWWQWTVDTCPGTLEDHKSRFKLAELAYLRGDPDEAIARFTRLAEQPDGPLAPEAVAWLRFLQEPEPPAN